MRLRALIVLWGLTLTLATGGAQAAPEICVDDKTCFAAGEKYFQASNMKAALWVYQKVVERRGPLAPYARHKMAWCRYNLGEFAKSLGDFLAVAEMTRHGRDAETRRLHQEVIRDLPAAYAEVGNPNKAWRFFRRLMGDAPKTISVVESLARQYANRGKFLDARQVYRGLLKQRSGEHLVALRYQTEVLDIATKTNASITAEFQRMMAYWDAAHRHLPADAKGAPEARARAEAITLALLAAPAPEGEADEDAKARAAAVCARWAGSVSSGPVVERCNANTP